MAFRGFGRGRGRYGGGYLRGAKHLPFELFPEIKELGTSAGVKQRAFGYLKFQKYWRFSPYYLDEENEGSEKTQITDIERYSDKKSGKTRQKRPLSDFIPMEPDYLPAELARGEKKVKCGSTSTKWNPDGDLKKLDVFEKLEQRYQGQGEKEGKEEEEDIENPEEEEQEYSDDGDYNQNRDFDDDEDDFNMADDNDDEPMFEERD